MSIDNLNTWEECVEGFVRCDHHHCSELDEIRSKGVLLIAAEIYPKEFQTFLRCSNHFASDPEASEKKCGPMIDTLLEASTPVFDNATTQFRAFQPDALKNFNPDKYRDPFWFSPLGVLWKRQRHNHDLNHVACLPIEQAAKQCVSDTSVPDKDCIKFNQMAYICRSGISSVHLQDELRQCYENFEGLGARKGPLNQDFVNCTSKVTGFQPFLPQ